MANIQKASKLLLLIYQLCIYTYMHAIHIKMHLINLNIGRFTLRLPYLGHYYIIYFQVRWNQPDMSVLLKRAYLKQQETTYSTLITNAFRSLFDQANSMKYWPSSKENISNFEAGSERTCHRIMSWLSFSFFLICILI